MQAGTQRSRAEMGVGTLVCSPLNHLTRLIARENFIIPSRRESNKSHLVGILADEVGETRGTHVEGRSVYRVLVGSPEGKRPLGRPRRRWED
jgi:hypothetical protein